MQPYTWICAVELLKCSIAIPLAAQTRTVTPQEQWVNPGIEGPLPDTAAEYMKDVDIAFIGILESMESEFLGDELFTKLRFRPQTWIQGRASRCVVDVFTLGGTFFETARGRVPNQVAEIAQLMQVGSSYFIAALYERRSGLDWSGKYVLAGTGSVARIEGDNVTPVLAVSHWVDQILEHSGGAASPIPGRSPTRAEAFIGLLRAAAKQ